MYFIVSMVVILLLIQLQGLNNLYDFKTETVRAERFGMFSSKQDCAPLPSVQHWTALPYLCFPSSSIKIGDVDNCVCVDGGSS